jgi:voltage-gated potassium channel
MKMMFVAILSIMIVAGSSSILIAESGDPNANIKTSEEALWWSFVTLATVGYGDYYPVTTGGRIIAVVMSLGGIGLFGAFTGTLMNYFIKDEKDKNKPKE